MIAALTERYPAALETEDFSPQNDAYVEAMRKIFRAHPEDLDIITLFAESLMNRTPWQLWDVSNGKPAAGADTEEAIEVLEIAYDELANKGSK